MKNLPVFLILILSTCLLSCKEDEKASIEKQYELRITTQMNEQVLFGIKARVEEIRMNIRYGGFRERDLRILKNSERLASLREKYFNAIRANHLDAKNKDKLLAYTDTILKINQHRDYNSNFIYLDPVALKEITRLKNEVINSNDSLAQAKLLFWDLKAETQFQNENDLRVGSDRHKIDPRFMCLINSEKLKLGDSVYIIVSPFAFSGCYDFLQIKPISGYFINKITQEKVFPKPVTIGMQHMFYTIPQKKGKYAFHSKFLIVKSETINQQDDTITVTYTDFEVF